MKALITTLTIAAVALVGTATRADARPKHGHHDSRGHHYRGYQSCENTVRKERYLVGYDRCGNPVWGYRIVHVPRYYQPEPRPYYSAPVCPPPRPACNEYRGSGIVIQGSFRL